MYLFQIHDCYNRLNWDPNRLNLLNNNTINKKRNYAKYNMSTPMFKYTSSKKNEGEGVLYPYASLAVQFTDLHQATLLYCQFTGLPSIKRFPVYTTLSWPSLTHVRTRDADLFLRG